MCVFLGVKFVLQFRFLTSQLEIEKSEKSVKKDASLSLSLFRFLSQEGWLQLSGCICIRSSPLNPLSSLWHRLILDLISSHLIRHSGHASVTQAKMAQTCPLHLQRFHWVFTLACSMFRADFPIYWHQVTGKVTLPVKHLHHCFLILSTSHLTKPLASSLCWVVPLITQCM